MTTKGRGPICVGLLGWDVTTIGVDTIRSHGGAAFHFSIAAAVLGVGFRIVSYTNLGTWSPILAALSDRGVGCDSVMDWPETIELRLVYDADLRFQSDRFLMMRPKAEPDVSAALAKLRGSSELIHLCPTVPEQDRRNLEEAAKHGAELSLQVHITNLTQDLAFYRGVIREVDYLYVNREEAFLLAGTSELLPALEKLRALTRACIYITSPFQVLALVGEDVVTCPTIPIPVVDPTGAGDAFAGGCTAARLLTGSQDAALRGGILCASAKLRGYSSYTLLSMLMRDPPKGFPPGQEAVLGHEIGGTPFK